MIDYWLLSLLAIVFYGWLLHNRRAAAWWAGVAAGGLHGASVVVASAPDFRVGLGNMLSAAVAVAFVLAWRGLVFVPTRRALAACTAAAVLMPWALPPVAGAPAVSVHAVLALAVYSLSAAACWYCFDMYWGEKQLRQMPGAPQSTASAADATDASAPAFSLLAAERRCFRYIVAAFAILTLTLLSGFVVAYLQKDPLWTLTHKNLFAVLTWLVYAVLLCGHYGYGWRGQRAVRWFATGFVFLFLSYIGSRFVSQILLA